MKFIRKTAMAMSKVHIDSSVQFSEETFPWGRQEAERRVRQQVQFYFTLAFGYHPHPSWVTVTEDIFLEDTRVQLLTIRAALPLKGTETILEGERFAWRLELHHTDRLPLVEKSPFVNAELPDVAQLQTRWVEHTGWDADSGLMVFGKETV